MTSSNPSSKEPIGDPTAGQRAEDPNERSDCDPGGASIDDHLRKAFATVAPRARWVDDVLAKASQAQAPTVNSAAGERSQGAWLALATLAAALIGLLLSIAWYWNQRPTVRQSPSTNPSLEASSSRGPSIADAGVESRSVDQQGRGKNIGSSTIEVPLQPEGFIVAQIPSPDPDVDIYLVTNEIPALKRSSETESNQRRHLPVRPSNLE
jgi:hypothetical protein